MQSTIPPPVVRFIADDDADTPTTARALAAAGIPVFPLHALHEHRDRLACDCERWPGYKAKRAGAPPPPRVVCSRAGKHPAIKRGHLAATTDAAEVERHWALRPRRGLGVRCGPLGAELPGLALIVLDFDGPDGASTLAQLEADNGQLFGLCVVTGRGEHRWFIAPASWAVRCAVGWRPGLDIRAAGGFVVAPPTLHRTGVVYRWRRLDDDTLDDVAGFLIPPAPPWLEHFLPALADGGAPLLDVAERRRRWALVAVRGEVADIEGAPPGRRNAALSVGALRAFRVADAAELSAAEVRAGLESAGLAAGLPAAEVRATLDSAARAAAQAGPADLPSPSPSTPSPARPGQRQRQRQTPPRGGRGDQQPVSQLAAELGDDEADDGAEHWTPPGWPSGAAPLPRFLRASSQTALAVAFLAALGLGRPDVARGADGLIWRWTGRVWAPVDDAELSLWFQGLDGLPIVADGGGRPRRASISHSTVSGATKLAVQRAASLSPLPPPPGACLALADGLLSLDAEGAPKLAELAPSSWVRHALPMTSAEVLDARPGPWAGFLAEVLSADVAEALAELVGLALFGVAARFARAGLLLGAGANGKSTALDVIAELFPEGVASVPPSKWADGPSAVQLRGRRLNVVAELPATGGSASSVFKEVVSGDQITRRDVYKAAAAFRPVCLHLFSANDAPETADHSAGFWRRWVVLPFSRTIPEADRNPQLAAELGAVALAEVARWAVEGAGRALARGHLQDPPSSAAALADWRTSADPVSLWWTEAKGDHSAGSFKSAAELHRSFQAWAEGAGFKRNLDRLTWKRAFQNLPGITDARRASARGFTVNTE